jgi:DNA-binding transcriptional regulator YiaG
VHVDRKVFVRVQLSVACELADRGMRTGDTLRQMRKALGLRAVDLARLLDVTAETISHWETGKARPTRATFAAVAAMADEAIDGRTSTRDRLSVEADGQSHPRTLAVKLRAPSRA